VQHVSFGVAGVVHKEKEAGLRKRKLKLETDVATWLEKFDQEMQSKQEELDGITQQVCLHKHVNFRFSLKYFHWYLILDSCAYSMMKKKCN
jgi:hypothetical protein